MYVFTKEGAGISFFFLGGGGANFFSRSRFIKAIISIYLFTKEGAGISCSFFCDSFFPEQIYYSNNFHISV